MSKNVLYLIRGIPGSGKTHLAKQIRCESGAKMFAADDYFTDETGQYNYIREELALAHAQCQFSCNKAMREGGGDVIVHNTFTQHAEMQPYLTLAEKHGYEVVEITVKSSFKNTHGVPDETIERMKARWEA